MEGGFAPTFKEAVGRWRRRHRHPPASEQWFAVHYRVGWLVERLTTLESIHLLRQGLDVRPLAAERPKRRRDGQPEEEEPTGESLEAGESLDAGESLEGVDSVEVIDAGSRPDEATEAETRDASTPPRDGA